MAQIELLQIGCTGEELINKINEIIAAVNASTNVSSYSDLDDLPSLNGVELKGSLSTSDLAIRIEDASDYEDFSDAFATKEYVDGADTQTVAAAESAAQAVLDSKLNKDLSNIAVISTVDEDAALAVVTADGLRKLRVSSLANNVAVRVVSTDSLIKAADDQLTKIELSGTQDGQNLTFVPESPFVAGTSHLFINGQRLVAGTDYSENGGRTITMLNSAPVSTDSLILVAVKK